MFPISTHVKKIEVVKAINKTEAMTTETNDPMSNMTVQIMFMRLLTPKIMCVLRFHTFLTRL